jgi:hypothetical protein
MHLVGIKEVIDCYGYSRLVVMHFVVSTLTGKCSVICIFIKGLTFHSHVVHPDITKLFYLPIWWCGCICSHTTKLTTTMYFD